MPKVLVKSDIVKVFKEYGAEDVDVSLTFDEERYDKKHNKVSAKIDKLPKLSTSNYDKLNTKMYEACDKRSTGKYEFKISDVEVKQKIKDGIYFDTEYSFDRKFETTTDETTTEYYRSYDYGGMNKEAVDSAKEWAESRTTTKYHKRSYTKTTAKDRYNAKKYGNAEDFYDDNYDDFDSYEDAEDYYNEYD